MRLDVEVERIDSRAFTVPTDEPESDGTLAWDSTTIVAALLPRRPAGSLGLEELIGLILRRHAWLPPAIAARWARSYGTRFEAIVGSAASLDGLGAEIAAGLFEAELAYLRDREWARSADDVLWRRSKLGLHLDEAGRQAVATWLGSRGASSIDSPATRPRTADTP